MRCWEIKTCREENKTTVLLAFIRPSLQEQIIWSSFILVLCTFSLLAFLLPPGTIFLPAWEIHIRYICHNINSRVVEKSASIFIVLLHHNTKKWFVYPLLWVYVGEVLLDFSITKGVIHLTDSKVDFCLTLHEAKITTCAIGPVVYF